MNELLSVFRKLSWINVGLRCILSVLMLCDVSLRNVVSHFSHSTFIEHTCSTRYQTAPFIMHI